MKANSASPSASRGPVPQASKPANAASTFNDAPRLVGQDRTESAALVNAKIISAARPDHKRPNWFKRHFGAPKPPPPVTDQRSIAALDSKLRQIAQLIRNHESEARREETLARACPLSNKLQLKHHFNAIHRQQVAATALHNQMEQLSQARDALALKATLNFTSSLGLNVTNQLEQEQELGPDHKEVANRMYESVDAARREVEELSLQGAPAEAGFERWMAELSGQREADTTLEKIKELPNLPPILTPALRAQPAEPILS